jgi:hypothetical protein
VGNLEHRPGGMEDAYELRYLGDHQIIWSYQGYCLIDNCLTHKCHGKGFHFMETRMLKIPISTMSPQSTGPTLGERAPKTNVLGKFVPQTYVPVGSNKPMVTKRQSYALHAEFQCNPTSS